jgi:tripartite-type tricarboxylate transporter receptor subunit TctC
VIRFLLVLAWACAGFAGPAAAQKYPTKVIHVIAPFPPGNASDLVARIMADALGPKLGQTLVVENKPGASGTIGAVQVAKSAPDGHTLLMTSTSFSINTAVLKNMPYDIEKDFEPVALLAWVPMVLVVNNDFPAKDLREFVDLVKKSPDKYSYGHVGKGSIQNLTMELFLATAKLQVVGVPYKGSSQAISDVVAGQIPFMFDATNSSMGMIKGGRVRPLVQSGTERFPGLETVPTAAETGVADVKGFLVTGWAGMLAPAGTPKPIVKRLNDEIAQVMQSPEVRDRYAKQGLQPYPPSSPERFAEYLRDQVKKWGAAASAAKIEKE